MKLNGINWLFKKKKVKTTKKCLDCNNQAKSSKAKYCIDCKYKRELENNRIQKTKKIKMNCKHNQTKAKCAKCFEEKFGSACKTCGKRKKVFGTSNGAEGGKDSLCNCN